VLLFPAVRSEPPKGVCSGDFPATAETQFSRNRDYPATINLAWTMKNGFRTSPFGPRRFAVYSLLDKNAAVTKYLSARKRLFRWEGAGLARLSLCRDRPCFFKL